MTLGRDCAGSLPRGATPEKLVGDYEPLWAIGAGLTPMPADITEILSLPDADGAPVSGASLKADDFWAIAQACG